MSRLLIRELPGRVVDIGFEESTVVRAVSFARVLVLCTECLLHLTGCYVDVVLMR